MSITKATILFVIAAVISAAVVSINGNDGKTDPKPWAKVRRGMTKHDVNALLGEPISRSGPSTSTVLGLTFMHKEFWQYYGGSWLTLLGPSDEAYVVYFSSDGKVASLREPKRRIEDLNAGQNSSITR